VQLMLHRLREYTAAGLHPDFPPIISRARRLLTCPAKADQVEVVKTVLRQTETGSSARSRSPVRLFVTARNTGRRYRQRGSRAPGMLDQALGRRMHRHETNLVALALHSKVQHCRAALNIAHAQPAQFLAAHAVIEQGREDGAIAHALERVLWRRRRAACGPESPRAGVDPSFPFVIGRVTASTGCRPRRYKSLRRMLEGATARFSKSLRQPMTGARVMPRSFAMPRSPKAMNSSTSIL
jgi:hypothetical protein